MQKSEDTIIQGKTRLRREFCSYYTSSDPILSYMVSRLDVSEGDIILEPCAGSGVFIEKIHKLFKNTNYKLQALESNPRTFKKLQSIFKIKHVDLRQADTLMDKLLDNHVSKGGFYTKVIGNPPYGAWLNDQKKQALKKKYGSQRETYTLFMRRAVELLKQEGKLVFIIPDTFLALHTHKKLREFLLKGTSIEEILLIPSRFFPEVRFGYANLCVISLTKTPAPKDHSIKIVQVKSDIHKLYELANFQYTSSDFYQEIQQDRILKSVDYGFFLGGSPRVRDLINSPTLKLGDLATCVTGFCSGDNRKFYRSASLQMKKTRNYKPVDKNLIEFNFLNKPNLLTGLNGEKKYIPIIKQIGSCFKQQTNWFVLWDKKQLDFYKTSKRSRFQNSRFYFQEGIGVSMVKGARMRACSLERRLFDQSIVGIFPRNPEHFLYLLGFLNSKTCDSILKTINHTANNSANYLKKLPIIIDSKYFSEVNRIVSLLLLSDASLLEHAKSLDSIFQKIYKIPEQSQ